MRAEMGRAGRKKILWRAAATGVLAALLLGLAADCGLGVYAAAKALGLDFVPLARERYDLVVPTAYLGDPKIKAVLETVGGGEFAARVEALGGYETAWTGRIMAPGMGLPG